MWMVRLDRLALRLMQSHQSQWHGETRMRWGCRWQRCSRHQSRRSGGLVAPERSRKLLHAQADAWTCHTSGRSPRRHWCCAWTQRRGKTCQRWRCPLGTPQPGRGRGRSGLAGFEPPFFGCTDIGRVVKRSDTVFESILQSQRVVHRGRSEESRPRRGVRGVFGVSVG